MVDPCGALQPFHGADRRTLASGIQAFRAVRRRVYADRHKRKLGAGWLRPRWRWAVCCYRPLDNHQGKRLRVTAAPGHAQGAVDGTGFVRMRELPRKAAERTRREPEHSGRAAVTHSVGHARPLTRSPAPLVASIARDAERARPLACPKTSSPLRVAGLAKPLEALGDLLLEPLIGGLVKAPPAELVG
jgi:hypothetical protein